MNDSQYDLDIDENHEKDRDRKERLADSKKARAKRRLIRDKHMRKHDAGYAGNV